MKPLVTHVTAHHITETCCAIGVATNAVHGHTNFLQDSLGYVSELLRKLGNSLFAKA